MFKVDETSCKYRCCNKCDMYRKKLESVKERMERESAETTEILESPHVDHREYFFIRKKHD